MDATTELSHLVLGFLDVFYVMSQMYFTKHEPKRDDESLKLKAAEHVDNFGEYCHSKITAKSVAEQEAMQIPRSREEHDGRNSKIIGDARAYINSN